MRSFSCISRAVPLTFIGSTLAASLPMLPQRRDDLSPPGSASISFKNVADPYNFQVLNYDDQGIIYVANITVDGQSYEVSSRWNHNKLSVDSRAEGGTGYRKLGLVVEYPEHHAFTAGPKYQHFCLAHVFVRFRISRHDSSRLRSAQRHYRCDWRCLHGIRSVRQLFDPYPGIQYVQHATQCLMVLTITSSQRAR